MGCARNPDARGDANRSRRTHGTADPNRALSRTEVHTVKAIVDEQCGGQAARPASEIEQARDASMAPHQRNSVKWLERANQNSAADAVNFGSNVEEPMHSVGESDVRSSVGEKERIIRARLPGEGVSGGVAGRIGFGLDDASADSAAGQLMDQSLTDQKPRQLDGVDGKLGAAKTPETMDLQCGAAIRHGVSAFKRVLSAARLF